MKHQAIAIEFADLMGRVLTDTDTPWRDVIGYQHKELDEIEAEIAHGDDLAESAETRDRLEAELVQKLRHTWWRVTWPEHVSTPRYNSDATYHQCKSREDACEDATEYGL